MNRDDGSGLTLSQVVFTGIPADGRGKAVPSDTVVPVNDSSDLRYFAKSPILLPDDVSWVSIEVLSGEQDSAWIAVVPVSVWTSDDRSWRLDDYAVSAVVLDLTGCTGLPRGLLGGIAVKQLGCVELFVRTSAAPERQQALVDYGSNTCREG